MTRPFTTVTSRAALLLRDDIDTDQIIPARFLTTTERAGLGQYAFSDWRYDDEGAPRSDFPLHAPHAAGAEILVAGRNFGCGSSREHAPWALLDVGFRAIVARSFGDIFRGNALKNGLLPVTLEPPNHDTLVAALTADPRLELTVDLGSRHVSLPTGQSWEFPVPEFSRRCLLDGVDQLGYLLALDERITAFEAAR